MGKNEKRVKVKGGYGGRKGKGEKSGGQWPERVYGAERKW